MGDHAVEQAPDGKGALFLAGGPIGVPLVQLRIAEGEEQVHGFLSLRIQSGNEVAYFGVHSSPYFLLCSPCLIRAIVLRSSPWASVTTSRPVAPSAPVARAVVPSVLSWE